ncbi:MAG TPA: hypothetical protein VKZ53_15865 [Candidatus Angelobacter sp.]|nr:hypothetical protein [Candidatus Angelobacter sp.]
MLRSAKLLSESNLPPISMFPIRALYNGAGDRAATILAVAGTIGFGVPILPYASWFLIGGVLFGSIAVLWMRAGYRHRAVEVKRLSIR